MSLHIIVMMSQQVSFALITHTYSLACELTHSLTYLLGAGIANEETELKDFRGTANGTSENPVSEYGLRETDHGNASDDDDEEEEEQISFRRNYEEIRFQLGERTAKCVYYFILIVYIQAFETYLSNPLKNFSAFPSPANQSPQAGDSTDGISPTVSN